MKDDFASRIAQSSQTIQTYSYPLLEIDGHGLPDIFASCLFLEVEKSIYLVTAAHALRGHSSGLLTRGNGQLINVAGRATVSRSAEKDHFDIAAVLMDPQLMREHSISVIPKTMLISSVEVKNPHSRAISGFPVSMNKQTQSLNRKTGTVTAKCYTYFGFTKFGGDFERFGKSPEIHIGLECGSGTDDKGRVLSSPPWPPRGVSGGGAWLIPDLFRPHLAFLEGIFIEGHKHAKKMYGFSTRLEHVVDFIKQTHNN